MTGGYSKDSYDFINQREADKPTKYARRRTDPKRPGCGMLLALFAFALFAVLALVVR
jgi:hypothetical protein